MGARQSRRSVDITTTPKKEGLPAEGGVGDAAAPGDGKLERIEEADTKPTTNGIAPHTDVAEDKDKDKDDATEKDKDKEKVRCIGNLSLFYSDFNIHWIWSQTTITCVRIIDAWSLYIRNTLFI